MQAGLSVPAVAPGAPAVGGAAASTCCAAHVVTVTRTHQAGLRPGRRVAPAPAESIASVLGHPPTPLPTQWPGSSLIPRGLAGDRATASSWEGSWRAKAPARC